MQLGTAGERDDLQLEPVLFEDAGLGADIGEGEMEIVAGGIADADQVFRESRRRECRRGDDGCSENCRPYAHSFLPERHAFVVAHHHDYGPRLQARWDMPCTTNDRAPSSLA